MAVALVTGSGKKRVGAEVARWMAEKGWHVAVHYRESAAEAKDTVEGLRGMGVKAEGFQADLREEGAVRKMVEAVVERFGGIDAVVNCAAIWERKRLEEVTADDVRRHFEVNTLGTFLCAQQAGLVMCGQESGGVIVNVGDWAEARPYLDYAAYFPSKGAVSTMTRSLAVEFAARNPKVRVNCVLPGPVMLPMDLPAADRAEAVAGTLVKREGSPWNVAQAVWSLIENDFVTGVCLPVDGGRTLQS